MMEPQGAPRPEITAPTGPPGQLEGGAPPVPEAYLLWSHKHGAWFAAGAEGYTMRLSRAGVFPLSEAVERAARAIAGTANRIGSLPVLPVPATAAAAMVAQYRTYHPTVPAEDWE